MALKRWAEVPAEKLSDSITRQMVGGKQATLARFSLARGAHVGLHQHESEQYCCVQQGALKMKLAGNEMVLRPGDVLVIPSMAEHEAWAMEDCVVMDFFSPPRQDWLAGSNDYLKGK